MCVYDSSNFFSRPIFAFQRTTSTSNNKNKCLFWLFFLKAGINILKGVKNSNVKIAYAFHRDQWSLRIKNPTQGRNRVRGRVLRGQLKIYGFSSSKDGGITVRNWKYFESMLSSFYSLPSNSFKPYSIFNDLALLRNGSWLLHSQPLGFTSYPSQTCPKLLVHWAGIIYKQLGWKRKKKYPSLLEN